MIWDAIVYISGVILVAGAIFTFLAAVGVVRLPDLYTRMHAASKAGAVGGGLILLVVAILSQDSAVAIRAIIGIIFLLLTTPVSAHLLAKASLSAGYKPWDRTAVDDNITRS
jgi:multicomponent Na+:H+ antiporter subunit G